MTKILFIGTFLSRIKGSKGVAESLAENLVSEDIQLKLISKYENKLLRIIDITWAILMFSGKKINIDVFSDQAFYITRIGSKVARFRDKEVIFTLRGGKLTEFADKHPKKVNRALKRANYIQTPSLFLKEYFVKQGFNIHYMPNAVNLSKFPYGRKVENPYSLLWVRSFISIYNPSLAIKTLLEVHKKYPQCTLTMVGPDNNGLLTETKKLAEELGLKNFIEFTGPKPNEELYQYYQTHRVFLNTTSYESFGVAVLEAASCGIPIISTKVGEIPYLWEHNKNILMVNDFEAKSFALEIFRLFETEGLDQQLSLKARETAENFEWENIKPAWIKLLRE